MFGGISVHTYYPFFASFTSHLFHHLLPIPFTYGMKQKIHFSKAFHLTLFWGNLQNEECVNPTDL